MFTSPSRFGYRTSSCFLCSRSLVPYIDYTGTYPVPHSMYLVPYIDYTVRFTSVFVRSVSASRRPRYTFFWKFRRLSSPECGQPLPTCLDETRPRPDPRVRVRGPSIFLCQLRTSLTPLRRTVSRRSPRYRRRVSKHSNRRRAKSPRPSPALPRLLQRRLRTHRARRRAYSHKKRAYSHRPRAYSHPFPRTHLPRRALLRPILPTIPLLSLSLFPLCQTAKR